MVASSRSEVSPVAAGRWLAWTVEAGAGLRRGEMLARRDGGRTFSVNGRAGTGLTGAISGATLVYERIAPGGRESGLAQYAASVRRDGTLVFGRSVGRCGVGVQLVERTLAGRERVLARLPENVAFATTYSAGGWVYYDRVSCRRFASDVYRVRTG